jgi:tRNA pseudouridine55 synthase
MEGFDPFDGALLVDKPPGLTSHDVVYRIRRTFQFNKVGHCGTLDPSATGLLIIVIGKATKLSERIMGGDKVYEGIIRFGETTNSYDADGELVASMPVLPMTLEELNAAAAEFQGDQMQTPPMVSAVKVEGVPLYKLARKGIEVERKPRLIHIYSFKLSAYNEPDAQFRIASTKGTYVRSLAHDLGQKLGCGAHLKSLRRTVSGKYNVADALPMDALLQMPLSELEKRVIPFLKLAQNEQTV